MDTNPSSNALHKTQTLNDPQKPQVLISLFRRDFQRGLILTIVVGERKEKYTYGFVTARSSRKEEKSFYEEFIFERG